MSGIIAITILIIILLYEVITRAYAEIKAKQINDAYKKLRELSEDESTKE